MKHIKPLLVAGHTALSLVTTAAFASHELEGSDVASGRALYSEQCATCHGENLEGQPKWQTPGEDGVMPAPPHDETGHTWHHDNGLLIAYTKLGGQAALEAQGITGFTSGMPGFGETLRDEDILNILGYIQSTWPRRLREIQTLRSPPHK